MPSYTYKDLLEVLNKKNKKKEDLEYLNEFRKRADIAYYRGSSLLIPDFIFDKLNNYLNMVKIERIVLSVEKKDELFIKEDSIKNFLESNTIKVKNSNIDFSNDRKEVEHKFKNFMCTLENSNINNLFDWLGKFSMYPVEKLKIAASIKYDGQSAALEYENGRMISAKSRGDGVKGIQFNKLADFLNLNINTNNFPLLKDKNFVIKCELVIPISDFIEHNSSGYNNPRSAVQAMTNLLTIHKDADYLKLAPVDIIIENDNKITREEKIEILRRLNSYNKRFLEPVFLIIDPVKDNLENMDAIFNAIEELYKYTLNDKNQFDVYIDGIVLDFVEKEIIDKKGFTEGLPGYPKYARALKFQPEEEVAIVDKIVYDFGYKTGRITPCVILNPPVKMKNNTYSKVSLSNFARFRFLNLGKGSHVIFSLSEDVLGYVSGLDCEENLKVKPFKEIEDCPICKSKLVNDSVFKYCVNNDCTGNKIGKFLGLFETTNILGIAENTIEKLIKAKLLNNLQDLFFIDKSKLLKIPTFEEKSSINILKAINELNGKYDYQIIAGLPIEGIGLVRSKKVFEKITITEFLESDNLFNLLTSLNIKTIGEETIKQLCKLRDVYKEELLDFLKVFNILSFKNKPKETLKVVISGSVDYEGGRIKLIEFLVSKNIFVASNFSKELDYLITDEDITMCNNAKIRKALESNTKILSTKEFISKVINDD
jgi:DNA ligase (NAD+)